MTTTGRTDSTTPPQARLDRRVLVADLVSGAMWLVPLAFLSWPMSLFGSAYVVAASAFLAAVYARGTLSRRHEALAWATPWLAAVAVMAALVSSVSGATGDEDAAASVWLPLLWGLVLGTLSYLAWQVSALAVRQLLAWRAR